MILKKLFFNILFLIPFALNAVDNKDLDQLFLRELESAKYSMSLRYGPQEWKQSHFNWDVDIAFEEAKAALFEKKPSSIRGYQRIFRDFLGTTQDYHVGVHFFSTETALIPISVKSVNGRYFISQIEFDQKAMFYPWFFGFDPVDDEAYFTELSKCEIGDEIISINGVEVEKIIEQLIDNELSGNRTPTGYALAERMLFTRIGSMGHDVPKGNALIRVKTTGNRKLININLPWIHSKEWVKDVQPKSFLPTTKKWRYKIEEKLNRDFSVEIAQLLLKKTANTKKANCDAGEENEQDYRSKNFLPPLGPILWETPLDSPVYAYIYWDKTGKQVGYLYIPHFMEMEESAEWMIDEYIEILKLFNEYTEGLVLDINNNPGGSYFYMLAVLSLFTDKPFIIPTQTETLIQEDVFSMAALYNDLRLQRQQEQEMNTDGDEKKEPATLGGYVTSDTDIDNMMAHALTIIDLWESGERKTPALPMFGFAQLNPHPEVQYTKPIVLLINELDFSCGDLFPAIMQDNQRAHLFGKKTAGAGGYVRGFSHTGQFGVSGYSLTGSLCRRIDGSVIENLGVTPETPYEVTVKDLQGGYTDYIRAVNETVKTSLLK